MGRTCLEDKVLGDDREVHGALGGQALQPPEDGQNPGQNGQENLQDQTCTRSTITKLYVTIQNV